MMFVLKIFVSAFVIAGASEVAKRSSFWASIIVSLPLISILTLSWVYLENRNPEQVQHLSLGILLAVIPSLLFFIVLSGGLKLGFNYPAGLVLALVSTVIAYAGWTWILARLGFKI